MRTRRMKSLILARVERDRAVTGSSGWSYPVSGRRSHEMRLSDGARNRVKLRSIFLLFTGCHTIRYPR